MLSSKSRGRAQPIILWRIFCLTCLDVYVFLLARSSISCTQKLLRKPKIGLVIVTDCVASFSSLISSLFQSRSTISERVRSFMLLYMAKQSILVVPPRGVPMQSTNVSTLHNGSRCRMRYVTARMTRMTPTLRTWMTTLRVSSVSHTQRSIYATIDIGGIPLAYSTPVDCFLTQHLVVKQFHQEPHLKRKLLLPSLPLNRCAQ